MKTFQFAIIMLLLIDNVLSEEWYQPDSHLINQKQFQDLVINDKTAFKIVKYFSPHCGYCRYLKQVVDKLKHEKDWCFKIYDFNCMWYPQHCMTNVRSSAFPYTAIHDENGQLHEQIHGFYPEPVIRQIFDRIESLCLDINKLKVQQSKQQISQPQITIQAVKQSQNKPSLSQSLPETSANNKQAQKSIQTLQNKQTKIEEIIPTPTLKQQAKIDEPKIVLQEQQITLPQANPIHEDSTTNQHKDTSNFFIKYLIYGITAIISCYYFYYINKGKQIHSQTNQTILQKQNIPLIQQNNMISQQESKVDEIICQQSQLIDNLPDQQL